MSLSSNYPKNSRSSEREFFIQADRLGISSRRSRVYHQHGVAVLYLITPLGVHQKFVGLMIYKAYHFDDMQFLTELMIYNGYAVDFI